MSNQNKHPYQNKEGGGEFGKRLKAERIRRGFQLLAFATATGIDQTQISGYENRFVQPTLASAIAMARVLDCSLDFLCGLED